MKVTVKLPNGLKTSHAVSKYLKGYNLEMTASCNEGMLADRLYNSKFSGPADSFGAPSGWSGGNISYCRSVPGLGYSGNEALLINGNCSISQAGIHLFAGEELEVEIVAKTRHAPVSLALSLKQPAMRAEVLTSSTIEVDTPCWKSFKATMQIPVDCNNAAFFISISGEGELHLDQAHLRPTGEIVSSKIINALRSLDMAALRFPGGCITTVYDWKKGLEPAIRRPVLADPQFNSKIAYDFGIQEFLELCFELKITPQITIGIGMGDAEDAADLATYCREFYQHKKVEQPLILFQIGNEQYAHHSMSHMKADNYLAVLREFVPKIKENYANSKIIGIYSFTKDDPWRDKLLANAAGLIDIVAYQYYKGQMKDTAEEQICNAAESVEKNRKDLVEIIEEIKERKIDLKVGFTEWNYWLYAINLEADGGIFSIREPMDAAHCLFIAGMLQMQAELGEYVRLSNFYSLLNGMSIFNHYKGLLEESSGAQIMRFYSPAFPAEYVMTKNNSPMLGEDAVTVSTMCVKTKEKMFLFAINYSYEEAVELSLPPEFSDASGVALHFAEYSNGVDIAPEKKVATGLLPPCSITRFEVKA